MVKQMIHEIVELLVILSFISVDLPVDTDLQDTVEQILLILFHIQRQFSIHGGFFELLEIFIQFSCQILFHEPLYDFLIIVHILQIQLFL